LLADLRRTRLRSRRYRYSNAGAGLLGLALARATGGSYEHLVQQHICIPLGLSSVTTTERQDLVDGANRRGRVAPHRRFTDALAGAGALRGTVRDLAQWAVAAGGGAPEPAGVGARGGDAAARPDSSCRGRSRLASIGPGRTGWATCAASRGTRAPLAQRRHRRMQIRRRLGANPGCLRYLVSTSDDLDAVWVSEVWADQAAHGASLEPDDFRALIQLWVVPAWATREPSVARACDVRTRSRPSGRSHVRPCWSNHRCRPPAESD
jgi:quinol monooxygenase YgiN